MSLKVLAALGCAVSSFALLGSAEAATTFDYTVSIPNIITSNDDPNYRGYFSGSGTLTADYDSTNLVWVIDSINGVINTSDWGTFDVNSANSGDDGSGNLFPATFYVDAESGDYVFDRLDLMTVDREYQQDHDLFFFSTGSAESYFAGMGDPLGFSTVTITPDAAIASVPEPASWAMMVGGFGLLGAALRRKRVSVSFG